MDTPLNTVSDVLDLFPSLVQLAADIGESQWKVIKWKKRKSIPPEYWSAICDAATEIGKSLTVNDLMRVHAASRAAASAAASAAG